VRWGVGVVRQVGFGKVRRGVAGAAWQGMAWYGEVRQVRCVVVRRGTAGHGLAGAVR
jgi:hypothetical protein